MSNPSEKNPRESGGAEAPRLSKALAAVFAVLMLGLCAVMAWQTAACHGIRARIAETEERITYYRDRLPRQQMEYGMAVKELPKLREEKETLPAQLEAAQREKQALKDERDRVKTGYSNIKKAAEAALKAAQAAETAMAEARDAYEALLPAGEEGRP